MKKILTLRLALIVLFNVFFLGSTKAQFFTENFEGTLTAAPGLIPTTWTETGLSNDGIWAVADATTMPVYYWSVPTHTKFAYTNDDFCNCDKSEDRLILPVQNFSSIVGGVDLKLDIFQDGQYGNSAFVQVSTNGGTTWTTVYTVLDNASWQNNVIISLNAYVGQSAVLVAFLEDDGANWSSGFAVDNVSLTQISPSVDASPKSFPYEYVSIPQSQLTGPQSLQATVANLGTVAGNVTLTAKVYVGPNYTTPVQTTSSTATSIPASGSTLLTAGTFTPSAYGTYVYEFISSVASDIDATNDTLYYIFEVTAKEYAKEDGDLTSVLGIGTTATGVFTNKFQINSSAVLDSVLFFSNGQVIGDSTRIYIYADVAGAPGAIVGQSDFYIFPTTPGSTGTITTLRIYDMTTGLLTLAPGNYHVGVFEEFNGSLGLGFGPYIHTNATTYYKIGGGAFAPIENLGAAYKVTPLIRPLLYNCSLSPLSVTAVPYNVTCNGANNGVMVASFAGGYPPYTYNWSNSKTTLVVTGLSTGTYNVTVTDYYGCTASAGAGISQPAAFVQNATVTNINCFGAANGSIDYSLSGGNTPYQFVWTNGKTTEDINGLSPGSYTLYVVDNLGCTTNSNYSISQPGGPLNISLIIASNNTNCTAPNGFINTLTSGGITPYVYTWTNGRTVGSITGLNAGSYSLNVTDANGCVKSFAQSISTVGGPIAILTPTPASCFGDNSGSINNSISGGTSPFTYAWSNGSVSMNITGLAAGTYNVTITDASGCISSSNTSITQPSAALSASSTIINPKCNNTSDGSISFTVSGGTTPYTYNWSNSKTTEDINNLAAGNFQLTITDSKGCISLQSVNLSAPAAFNTGTTSGHVTCFGLTNGYIDLTVTGATPPYSFLWSNGRTTEDLNNLAAGSYSGTVTDANGCKDGGTITITQPAAALVLNLTGITNPTSCSTPNGAINSSVSGGTTPYAYAWSNGKSNTSVSGLNGGNFNLVVTDANGCTDTKSTNLVTPGAPTIASSNSNATCNGGSNGSISLSVSGGTSPYNYAWSNASTVEDQSNLIAGNYNVTVTDAGACQTVAGVTITQPSAMNLNLVALNATCNSGTNGGVNLSVSGGTAGYTFSWSNGAITEDIGGLAANTYNVTVTDANLCKATSASTVSQPTAVNVSFASSGNPTNCSTANGFANSSVSGGTGPYTYLWSNNQTTANISGLNSGTFSLTATDNNGCTGNNSVVLTAPGAPNVTIQSTNVLCNGASNGAANLTVNGGTAPYTYVWSNGRTTEDITGIAASSYNVTISDAGGCAVSATATVSQPNAIVGSTISSSNVSCNGLSNGKATVSANGGTGAFTYLWANGSTVNAASNLSAGTANVTITDANACVVKYAVTITQPAAINVTTSLSANTISALQSGATYQWLDCNNGNSAIAAQTGQTFTSMLGGSFSVRITVGACVSTSSCTSIVTTGVENVNANDFNVYPNPNAGNFIISTNIQGAFTLMNEFGQVVKTFETNPDNNFTVNIDQVSSGIYFIQGFNNNELVRQKVVVIK